MKTKLTALLNIDFPIIMAPMFLVSNEAMIIAGMKSGIAAAFPTLNYRKEGELEHILNKLNVEKNKLSVKGTYGVNLIVQRSNPLYEKHLKLCVEKKVPYYITSLGNPKQVIEQAHSYGAKVFCDVTNIEHAQKCFELGCDGFIAVGQGAGGHAGPNPLQILIPSLHGTFPNTPVIAAGGIATGAGILSMLALGATGVSIGTRFIACTEASVNDDYKNAIVDSKMSDIVLTEKISGTPCTIINTPFAQKIGLKQNWLEKTLSKNSTTKKYFKMLVQLRGMKKMEQSVKPGNYQTLWCAGQSVELIHDVISCKEIVDRLKKETTESYQVLMDVMNE
ncbi:MAG: 2-nitropropane dioxygenase [Bacteroidetes bacterium RIFCSPLOWO2_12_FULL_35_15]|nr:MAG: 2-nitropropane dioxygenase [Bacteroidetes bacterium RIFCSPLOWO2_12_FULL_35_15]